MADWTTEFSKNALQTSPESFPLMDAHSVHPVCTQRKNTQTWTSWASWPQCFCLALFCVNVHTRNPTFSSHWAHTQMFLFKSLFSPVAQPTTLTNRMVEEVIEWRQSMKSLLLAALCLSDHTSSVAGLCDHFVFGVCPGLGKVTLTYIGSFSLNCFRIVAFFPLPLTLFHLNYCLDIQFLVALTSVS